MNYKLILKLLAPYLAVGVFWCIFKNGWLAIIAYHSQILLWAKREDFKQFNFSKGSVLWLAFGSVVAAPALYFLAPYIFKIEVETWLQHYHLTGVAFLLMIPYFGIFHPFLEQVHWNPLRKTTSLAHLMFAGYHMIVLCSLLTGLWVAACFTVLLCASVMWHLMEKKTGSLVSSLISHILADFGMILIAWLLI